MNILFSIANKFMKVFHKFYHPITIGVRAIITNKEKDSVLLVKLSYANGWYLPGGKLKRGESIVNGLKRELIEELSFIIDENTLDLLGIYNSFYEGKSDTIIVFLCSGYINKNRKSYEIKEYQYFDFNDLPAGLSPGTKRRLDEYLRNKNAIIGEW